MSGRVDEDVVQHAARGVEEGGVEACCLARPDVLRR